MPSRITAVPRYFDYPFLFGPMLPLVLLEDCCDQMAARPTKIMVELGTNINCLLSYVATGASSRLSDGVKDIASKEGKGLVATKMTTEKKDKAKKAPSLAPPVPASR